VAGLLLFSHAFVDFSTSGLENPLSCLLLVALVALFLNEHVDRRRWLTGLWLLASLLYLTRPDDVLLALPVVLVASAQVRRVRQSAPAVVIGLSPALAWTVFAVIYYGFPFPNTAYAKLGMGISRSELWAQGVLYLVDSVDRDPLTLVVVAFGVGLAVLARSTVMRALAAGIVLYLVYVVSIGGDFMAGRFLSSPFYLAVLIIGRSAIASREIWIAAPVALGALAFSSPQVPIGTDSRFESANIKPNGIVGERAIYFRKSSLSRAGRWTFAEPEYPMNDHKPHQLRIMELCGLTGDAGVNWGPRAHVLDWCALVDPLLARLPAVWNVNWRIGHFRRMYPKGYRRSLETGINVLEDPALRAFYDRTRLITRSPNLFSSERWRAIVGMNTGKFDHLIDRPYYRFGGEITRLEDTAWVKPEEATLDVPGSHSFENALAVTCEDRRGRRYLDISVSSEDAYKLEFIKKNNLIGVLEFGPIPEHRRRPGLTRYTLDIPARAATGGFDTIVIGFVKGGTSHALGHLLLDGNPTTDPELLHRVALRDGVGAK
jgi:arabinofuranosyltransferase